MTIKFYLTEFGRGFYANDLNEEITRKDMEHKRLSGPKIKYKRRQDLREGVHYVRLIFSYNQIFDKLN